jgi:sugar O-acyltransferase (sialic acid O-acetyltransferase NeuD family)
VKKKIILIGGGGHCISCIDVVESTGIYIIHGILDVAEKLNQKLLQYQIIGTDEDIPRFVLNDFSFLISLGFISNPNPKINLFRKLQDLHANMPSVLSCKAHVSQYATIGIGTIVMHNAVVNADTKIGCNVIINTGAVVEHSAEIGNHTHISTGAFINGDCIIGNSVFVGSNSVIGEGVSVTDDVVIGAGSVVIRSIQDSGVYVGNPVRKIH